MRHSCKEFVAALAMSAGLIAPVMAEVVSTQPVFSKAGSAITIIPGDYLTDGRPQIMIADTDNLGTTLRLYNADFASIDDVVVHHPESLKREVTERRSLSYSWPVVMKTKLLENMPLSEVQNYIRTNYGYVNDVKEFDGGTDLYVYDYRFVIGIWEEPEIGGRYIYKVWFRFEPDDAENPQGNGVLYSLEGEGDAPNITLGEWYEVDSREFDSYPIGEVGFMSDNGSYADCSLVLTQTLFNEDDEYEYISRDYELRVEDWYESGPTISGELMPTYRYTKNNVVCSGFCVKSASGTTLQSVRFPEEFISLNSPNFRVLELSGRRYLCCESPSEVIIYAINGEGTGLRQVGQPIAARVFPTILSRGEGLSIERSDDSDEARINVFSGDGMHRYSGNMQPGERLKTLSTDGFPDGLNIVTIEDDSHRESTKILVK